MDKHDSDSPIPDLERRYVALSLRAAGDEEKPVIEGDAAVFGVESVVGRWFREKIRAGAFTRVLSEKPDVIAAFNHDWTYVLGRTTAETLRLEQTDTALRYSIDVNPADSQAMSVWEKVKRGDVSQSSFAFTVRKEEWTEADDDGVQLALREIVEIGKLYDVGPVPFGQYPEASAQARSKSESFLQQRSAPQTAPGGAGEWQARQAMRRRRAMLAERSLYQNKEK
ncbi:HK97 family phage prohead protease [Chloroflexi bacterium CFX6]|nr:HK97 family phage prohead protease [Chloroflexi bacterium CFX6]